MDTLPVPALELSTGYVLMKDTGTEESYPAGWYFSGAVNLNRWFGLVGEGSGSYRSEDATFLSGRVALHEKSEVYAFLGGARFFHKVGRIVPFGQTLVGIANESLEQTETHMNGPGSGRGTWSRSSSCLAVQPGGGVTIYLTARVGVRVSGDYRIIIDTNDDDVRNEFRFLTGFTLQWGDR